MRLNIKTSYPCISFQDKYIEHQQVLKERLVLRGVNLEKFMDERRELATNFCSSFPVQVVKSVRFPLSAVEDLLEDDR